MFKQKNKYAVREIEWRDFQIPHLVALFRTHARLALLLLLHVVVVVVAAAAAAAAVYDRLLVPVLIVDPLPSLVPGGEAQELL